MKRRYAPLLTLLLACAMAVPAFAQIKVPQDETAPDTGPNCDLTGYKGDTQVFPTPVALPDNTDVLNVLGTLPTAADGDIIIDAIAGLTIRHTWVGDLVVRLQYVDCGTGTVLAQTNLLCRPRGTDVNTPAPCGTGTGVGASGDLGSGGATGTPLPYRFSDDATAPINEGVNPNPIPAGCYKPAAGQSMSVFRGLQKGGCWVLSAGDWAAGDLALITDWSVWTKNEAPVSTSGVSWGTLKSIYR